MDFSLTTLFVVPSAQATLPVTGSTQDLTAGQLGFYDANYVAKADFTASTSPYFYVAQGRENNYLQGSKRSDKIGIVKTAGNFSNIVSYYKVQGCNTPQNQVTKIGDWHVSCGEDVTVTLRAHSSYIDTLYYNGLTRSITVPTPCCPADGSGANVDVAVDALIDSLIAKFGQHSPGIGPDNIDFSDFYTFSREGSGVAAKLVITGKPLTKYGLPCDVAAFPHEYDRMWFAAFAYIGTATTADFYVDDACKVIAKPVTTQNSTYATGSAAEIAQMEKNFYSYQAGYLKHLYRLAGYNQNFETYVSAGATYDTYYVKFRDQDAINDTFGDYIAGDSTVIIAAVTGSAASTAIAATLETALKGSIGFDNVC